MRDILNRRFAPVSLLFVVALLFAFALALAPRGASAQGGEANVWVAHLAPFADTLAGTTVDIDITAGGNTTSLPDIQYKDTTGGYVGLPAGPVQIQVFPDGSTTPAIDTTLDVAADTDYTVAAIGGANGWPLELLALVDDNSPPPVDTGKIRIGHLAPFAATGPGTAVDIRFQSGVLVPGLGGIEYKTVSNYLPLPAIPIDLIITAPGGSPIYLDIPPFVPEVGTVTSIFAIGDTVNQPLEVFSIQTLGSDPTAVTLDTLESSAAGSYGWLIALGVAAVGAAALYRRRLA